MCRIILHFAFDIGPLILKDAKTGLYTVIGVASSAFLTLELYTKHPCQFFVRVNQVLPWIYHEMGENKDAKKKFNKNT